MSTLKRLFWYSAHKYEKRGAMMIVKTKGETCSNTNNSNLNNLFTLPFQLPMYTTLFLKAPIPKDPDSDPS
jgi:hypothetical protein